MEFGKTFYLLCEELNIGKTIFCKINRTYHFEISLEEFYILYDLGLIYNGSKGGLVLGKSHKDGGIHFLQQSAEDTLRYLGEMEGWEYLTSPLENIDVEKQFEIINNNHPHLDVEVKTDFTIPENCKVIDTSKSKIAILLISNTNQFVINRFATRKEIKNIIELDK